MVQGLTSNYLKVCFEGNAEWVGQIVPVKSAALQGDLFLGSPVLPHLKGKKADV